MQNAPSFSRPEKVNETEYLVIREITDKKWNDIPPDVQREFVRLAITPDRREPFDPLTSFSDIKAIKRADGVVLYEARINKSRVEQGDLGLDHDTAFFIDIDEGKKFNAGGKLGEAVVEYNSSVPRVYSFNTVDISKELHLSYPRLWAMHNYCLKVYGFPLSSGRPTETKGDKGKKDHRSYSGGEHIWKWFVDRRLAHETEDDKNRFMFSVPPVQQT